jgi:dATP pyrophosphohydrolase
LEAPYQIPVRCYAVSAVLILEDNHNQVLVLRRAESTSLGGAWGPVTGAIEAGENASQSALREIREETGLMPERFYSADYCVQFYEPINHAISVIPVFVGFVGEDQTVALNWEHSDYRWASLEEAIPLLTFGGQRAMFEHVRREFVEREPTEFLRIDLEGLSDPERSIE